MIYQIFMDKDFEGLKEFSLAYIDDILVFTKDNYKDHLHKVLIILEWCKEKDLILSKKKVVISKQEIDYLDLSITNDRLIKLYDNVLEKFDVFFSFKIDLIT